MPLPLPLRERLETLVAFLPVLERPGFRLGRWEGGDRRPDGTMTLPYFELDEDGLAFVRAIGEAGWVQPFDWMAWLGSDDGRALRDDPARLARATADDLTRLLTAIVRSERFGDGNLEGALESGLFLRILRRARVLLEELGEPDPPTRR